MTYVERELAGGDNVLWLRLDVPNGAVPHRIFVLSVTSETRLHNREHHYIARDGRQKLAEEAHGGGNVNPYRISLSIL
jgi:hypothetical protein